MGMSASQMRYCMLTGRKADVEFQGQQINQQRTTLATQTSGYNNQLLDLQVPTPPSSDNYVRTAYTFTSNGETRTVTGTVYNTTSNATTGAIAGTYTVNYTTDSITSQGKSSGSSIFANAGTTGNPVYTTSQGTILTLCDTNPASANYNATDAANTSLIKTDCGLDATSTFYKYTSSNGTRYVTQADLAQFANTTTAISTYYVDENASVTTNSRMNGASVVWSDTGRMTSITDSNGTEYSLNVTTTNDETAYNDAYNEYQYQKAQYDQEITAINAKISIIQSQDKKLELKLQDLDTQQEAINTEMDAVKKVIDKNIEQTFKAFG